MIRCEVCGMFYRPDSFVIIEYHKHERQDLVRKPSKDSTS